MVGRGPIRTEDRLREVLTRIWRGTVRVKSDLARDNADIIAMAASSQLITTRVSRGVFAGEWQITVPGLRWINETEE